MDAHPKLLKLARQALEISQVELAALTGLSVRTIKKLEEPNPDATFRTLEKVQAALEGLGISFLPDDGTGSVGFRLPRDALRK